MDKRSLSGRKRALLLLGAAALVGLLGIAYAVSPLGGGLLRDKQRPTETPTPSALDAREQLVWSIVHEGKGSQANLRQADTCTGPTSAEPTSAEPTSAERL